MSLAFWYWLIVVLFVLWGGYDVYIINNRVIAGPFFRGWIGNNLLLFILLVIIGLSIFHEGPFGALVK